jgi:hypothetical protein
VGPHAFCVSPPPPFARYTPVAPLSTISLPGAGVRLQFDASGGIASLIDTATGMQWANASAPLGRFVYKTYNERSFFF